MLRLSYHIGLSRDASLERSCQTSNFKPNILCLQSSAKTKADTNPDAPTGQAQVIALAGMRAS